MKNEHPINRRWNRRRRDWAVVIWMSFLSACIGSFVLFGLVSPLDITGNWAEQYDIGVRLAYGLVFAFLFLLSLLASSLTMFMIRTGPAHGHVQGKGRRKKPLIRDPSESNPDIDGEDWQ
jgi:hypothetical protein